MPRCIPIALLAFVPLFALCGFGGSCRANDEDCCKSCGCRLQRQVICEWATRQVLRYKAEHKECPPAFCVCCDDRWIIGCPKPIKVLSLVPYHEAKKFLVGQHVVWTCPQCNQQAKEPLPDLERSTARGR